MNIRRIVILLDDAPFMKPIYSLTLLLYLFAGSTVSGQSISSSVSGNIKTGKYLFYLHAGLVTELGNNALNQSVPEWGPYEYLNILDSLRDRGFNVFSEIRQKGLDDSVYSNKIARQIDSLMVKGVSAEKILVVGASSGWSIVLAVSSALKNDDIHYVIMGGCWPDTYKEYSTLILHGKFLSIIEASDPHGTCVSLFANRKNIKSFTEIKLNTGLSHGFIYKGRKAWIDPIVNWIN